MGNEWQRSKLGDVIAVNPTRPLTKGSDSVYISMQQVETSNRSVSEIDHRAFKGSGARFQNGDTLLARITPCLENGKTAYVDFLDDGEVGHGSTEFIVLSGIEGVSDDLFVYYLARYPEFRDFAIVRMEGSSGRQRVPAQTLKKYVFACPSYDEQHAIAHILGSLDDKIEVNRQMNQTVEATARAIFKSWFVDFDPVRAKAEGRPTGLPDDIAALFPDSFQESELGEIPKGWKVGVVSDLGNVICGKTPPTKDPENYGEDIPFITIPDMHGKVFVTHTGKYLSEKGANAQRNKYLPAKSICVSCIATPGLVVMTTEQSQTNQQINNVIPKNEGSSYYCFQALNRLGDQIRAGGSGGSVLLNLNKTLFSNIKILIPDYKIIESYQEIVEPFFEKLLQNQRESASLSSLRDTLLPKLISGELRIPDAEKFVEPACAGTADREAGV